MALNLGCKRVVELSQELENLGNSDKVTGALALLQDLETVFTQTKVQLLVLRDESKLPQQSEP